MVSDHDLLVRIDENVEYLISQVKDHEVRLRVQEAQRNRWIGRDGAIVMMISAAVSAFVAVFAALAGWRG